MHCGKKWWIREFVAPLYISFKSWLCCCSLPSVAPQQQRLRRQISLDYYTIPPATQARVLEFQFGGSKFNVSAFTACWIKMCSLVMSSNWPQRKLLGHQWLCYPYNSLFFKRLAQRTKIYPQVSFFVLATNLDIRWSKEGLDARDLNKTTVYYACLITVINSNKFPQLITQSQP